MSSPTVDVLFHIKRALAGYISYLAACDANTVFSEYLLYEPILRTFGSQKFDAESEVPCMWLPYNGGDRRRIDFTAKQGQLNLAIEVKWARQGPTDVEGDLIKLASYLINFPGSRSFLCVFGRDSHINPINLNQGAAPVLAHFALQEVGHQITADFKTTRYACRVYEVKQNAGANTPLNAFP